MVRYYPANLLLTVDNARTGLSWLVRPLAVSLAKLSVYGVSTKQEREVKNTRRNKNDEVYDNSNCGSSPVAESITQGLDLAWVRCRCYIQRLLMTTAKYCNNHMMATQFVSLKQGAFMHRIGI